METGSGSFSNDDKLNLGDKDSHDIEHTQPILLLNIAT